MPVRTRFAMRLALALWMRMSLLLSAGLPRSRVRQSVVGSLRSVRSTRFLRLVLVNDGIVWTQIQRSATPFVTLAIRVV